MIQESDKYISLEKRNLIKFSVFNFDSGGEHKRIFSLFTYKKKINWGFFRLNYKKRGTSWGQENSFIYWGLDSTLFL